MNKQKPETVSILCLIPKHELCDDQGLCACRCHEKKTLKTVSKTTNTVDKGKK